jgi:hypothetical protein
MLCKLRRQLIDTSVVVIAAMDRGAVEVSESINDQSVIGKRAIWRACEGMNNTLGPLAAAYGT